LSWPRIFENPPWLGVQVRETGGRRPSLDTIAFSQGLDHGRFESPLERLMASGRATRRPARAPPGARLPSQVLDELLPFVVGEVGEEGRADGLRGRAGRLVGSGYPLSRRRSLYGTANASLSWWRTCGEGFLTASFSSRFRYAGEILAARAASPADSWRTSRACLSTAPIDGATDAHLLQLIGEPTVDNSRVRVVHCKHSSGRSVARRGLEASLPRMPRAKEEALASVDQSSLRDPP
jgi:hypothetical protein